MFDGSNEQFERFEPWATAQTRRLSRAAASSTTLLAFEAEAVRSELEELSEPDEIAESRRTERMRHAQEHWLAALLKVVDELLADSAPAHA